MKRWGPIAKTWQYLSMTIPTFVWYLADNGFGELVEVPREPFVLHPDPRFPGETTASGSYAFVVNTWIYSDLENS